jgi:carbonic anhydrase
VTPTVGKSNTPDGAPGPTDAIAAFAEVIPDPAPGASTVRAKPSPAAAASGASPLPAAASSPSERTGGRFPTTPIVAAAVTAEQWSYDGDTGPEHWGRLRPEWKLCADGKQQSPIDVAGGIAVDLEPPRFDYRPTHFRITDTGRTLKVDVGAGMGVEIRGQRYELEHLQFHRPSVERVGGQASAMTVHFHHRAADGRIAIVAVLLERGEMPHPLVQTLWNSLPLERGGHYMPASATIDPATLIPADASHYLYLGSLVTPPCTEGVTWVVMKSALTLSDDQLAIFGRLYPRNARPLQPRNGRIVLESR